MSKEQKSNREKKKPKQDKSAKVPAAGTAYAQAFKTKGGKKYSAGPLLELPIAPPEPDGQWRLHQLLPISSSGWVAPQLWQTSSMG